MPNSTNFISLLTRIVSICALVPYIAAIRQYKDGEKVMLYVNKVGPYFNPQETYHYYQLPVCRPEKIEHRSLSLGRKDHIRPTIVRADADKD